MPAMTIYLKASCLLPDACGTGHCSTGSQPACLQMSQTSFCQDKSLSLPILYFLSQSSFHDHCTPPSSPCPRPASRVLASIGWDGSSRQGLNLTNFAVILRSCLLLLPLRPGCQSDLLESPKGLSPPAKISPISVLQLFSLSLLNSFTFHRSWSPCDVLYVLE